MIQELTDLFSKKGYEGLYLMQAVFAAAVVYCCFSDGLKEQQGYFEMRHKQITRKIKLHEIKIGLRAA